MKTLLIVAVLFLSGCVSATYRNGDQSVTYVDWFKRASDVKVIWGPVEIDIGNMQSELTAEDIAAYVKVMGAMSTIPVQ
jgi:hypothetical protein